MKNRFKEKHRTNEGYLVEIIAYRDNKDCDIKFEDGTVLRNVCYHHIRNGNIRNPYHPSVRGLGYVGQGRHATKSGNRNTKSYEVWNKMFQRCYDEKCHLKQPSYKGCSVDLRWFNFQVFGNWFEKNYNPRVMQNWHLDKDILVRGNKIYSPETCCFVPNEINTLFVKSNSVRGEYPIGVHKRSNGFVAQLNKNGKRLHLGVFDTPILAFHAYKDAKETCIKETAAYSKEYISDDVYQALMNYEVKITD